MTRSRPSRHRWRRTETPRIWKRASLQLSPRSTVGEARAPVNSKNLKNLPVMSIEGGEKLGTVSRAYVDAAQKRIVGFAYSAGGGFMQAESEPKLDAEEVHTLGPDALMLDHKGGETGASV